MEYPDSRSIPTRTKSAPTPIRPAAPKVGFRALYVRDTNVNYYEGEDGKEIERILTQRRKP